MTAGHVEPGGLPLAAALSATVTMIKMSVGPMDNNCYLLRPRTGRSVLIDAANDADRIVANVGEPAPDAVVTTHRHQDHWQALAALTTLWRPELYAGTADVQAIQDQAGVTDVHGVWDGDRIRLGDDESLEIIGLVGHTPGSVAVVYRGEVTHLFTGDSLFPGGVGKTATAQDFATLIDGVEYKLFDNFDDDTVVHPGHGDDTTLGAERPKLSGWRSRGW